MALYGFKFSKTGNKPCWVTGPACKGSVTSPCVVVVVPLKPERINPAEFNIHEESFIRLNAGSCKKSAALLGSTSILCTSKLLIHKVSTNAS